MTRTKISGTRGRYLTMYVENYQPEYGQCWWAWAGRISAWLAAMLCVILVLIVLSVAQA